MIDLHTHSVYSDGSDTPSSLALQADALGLTALALTDHDTLTGLPSFLAMQPQVRTRLIAGIELSCRFLDTEIHVLGLFLDVQDARLQARVGGLRRRRQERNAAICLRLQALGIPLTSEEVAASAETDLVSRAHLARLLVQKGHVTSPQEAFRRYLGEGAAAFVPFRELRPGEAATWIRDAGGVPVVAHPGRTSRRALAWEEAMVDLKCQGMGGLEAYYSDYSANEERYFRDLADHLDLACSGGSDYHGALKPGVRLGWGHGTLRVPDELLASLEAHRGHRPEESAPATHADALG